MNTTGWQDYLADKEPEAHTVTGTLRQWSAFYSPQLNTYRDLFVYLPPSYFLDLNRHFPVIYMHDGQNLFDAFASFVGEWQVDETCEALAEEGLELIVVGVANGGDRRIAEYSPFPVPERGVKVGQGDSYLRFVAEQVKPQIDADFRTLPQSHHTALSGSSLGGLISLYGFFTMPHVFGLAAVLSPALFPNHGAIFATIEAAAIPAGRLYLDVGQHEGRHLARSTTIQNRISGSYLDAARRMDVLLGTKGLRSGDNYRYVEDAEGIHHEMAWAKRLPEALRFLFA